MNTLYTIVGHHPVHLPQVDYDLQLGIQIVYFHYQNELHAQALWLKSPENHRIISFKAKETSLIYLMVQWVYVCGTGSTCVALGVQYMCDQTLKLTFFDTVLLALAVNSFVFIKLKRIVGQGPVLTDTPLPLALTLTLALALLLALT